MGWAKGAAAPPVKDRAAAARLASSGSGRLRDMPRRTQGECGSWSRRHGLRFSRDEDAGSRTRQWPILGLWEWRRARSASTNKRRCGERGGLDWRAPNGNSGVTTIMEWLEPGIPRFLIIKGIGTIIE